MPSRHAWLVHMPHAPLSPLPSEPQPGRYRHYKGNDYEVLGVARHSETAELLVIYRALAGDPEQLWARPHAMFIETVPVEGVPTPRFRRLG